MQDMKTIKVQLHLVATEEESPIAFEKDYGLKFIGTMKEGYYKTDKQQPQYLYFTSDEGIKEGDWCYHPYGVGRGKNKVFKAGKPNSTSMGYIPEEGNESTVWNSDVIFKIVASTDPKLNKRPSGEMGPEWDYNIPQPTKQVVEAYCKKPFDECLIEMEDDTIHLDEPKWQIKVNSYNEITCHPVVEKMYTREELDMEMNLLLRDVLTFQKDKHLLRHPSSNNIAQFVIDWTKENLK